MTDGPFNSHNSQDVLEAMVAAARAAGDVALAYFRDGEKTSAEISFKRGGSPVTEADFAVDRLLEPALRRSLPQAAYLSEERHDDQRRLEKDLVFIVDPIDGTRAFARGDKRWGISVALALEARPTLAVLHLPALGETFVAKAGNGASLNQTPIRVSRRASLKGAQIAGPASVLERLRVGGLDFQAEGRIPSLAYRIAKVAAGAIDVGVASADSYDWDIAAADLILREAGGLLYDLAGQPPAYNGAKVSHGALAAAGASLMPELLDAIRALDPPVPPS